MYRIASFTVAQYWRDYYKQVNGIDCRNCGKKLCKEQDYSKYAWACPRAIEIEYMSKPITDADGNIIELWQTLADDKAIDLDAWIDAKTWLAGCPQRLVRIATKKINGERLSRKDEVYLSRYRQKELRKAQKSLL
jgi:hypothetical protein